MGSRCVVQGGTVLRSTRIDARQVHVQLSELYPLNAEKAGRNWKRPFEQFYFERIVGAWWETGIDEGRGKERRKECVASSVEVSAGE